MGILAAAVSGLVTLVAANAADVSTSIPGAEARLQTGPARAALVLPVIFRDGMPTLDITLNGQGPFRVGVDTGAMGGVYLFGGRAEQVGLKAVGELEASDPSGLNPQRLSTYGDVSVGIGGRAFRSEVAGEKSAAPGRLEGLDGIVGLEAFGPALVTFDFAKQQIRIESGALPPPDGRGIFSYEGPLPQMPLEVEGHIVEAYLDTGNVRAGIVLPSGLADQLSGRTAASPAGVAHTISSDVPMYRLNLNARPRVGETRLASMQAQFPSVAPIGIVGAEALDGLIVRIDTANRRVQILAAPSAAPM